ncbi:unnamed protein product [Angiostrongylus costaricensis]|uniref:C2H2-type domain-containing protein n=1 Tax=Angiostrongylus costaricensis TaxID=334426 RepID=A0A0R3PL86_ANGCS|nr:unnamed protein product [Angiostrongylus costaricensis]
MNDSRWTGAVRDWIPRDVKRTVGRPPTRWSELFTKCLEERHDARRVPRASGTHWATLARDREKWKICWRPLESLGDQRDYRHTSPYFCTHLAERPEPSEHKLTRLNPSKIEKDEPFVWFMGESDIENDEPFTWSMDGCDQASARQLPSRPLFMPRLPDQLSQSETGSVICPVPKCTGRFKNHDSLCFHCMLKHAELGAAGTPQNFAVEQYRFDNEKEYKVCTVLF